jgi:predicted nucleic-acid-binding Zn-ribbon protein
LRTNQITAERSCVKCGSPRIRIVGQSFSPPVLHVTCENCGYASVVASSSPAGEPAHRMEAVTLERVVRRVIADFNLPMELVAVADVADGWQLTLRNRLHRPVRVHVVSAEPREIRTALTRALANA